MSEAVCSICSGRMQQIGKRKLGDSEYFILKCVRCRHQIARDQG
ncbi:MAG: hypothetical protein ABH879_08895 [archaeon]